MIYDNEEQNIIDAYEKSTIKLSTPSKQEIESIKMIAKILLEKIGKSA